MAEKLSAPSSGSTPEPPPGLTPERYPSTILTRILFTLRMIWEFTESNFNTFVLPNSAFGLFGAVAESLLAEEPGSASFITGGSRPDLIEILWRAPVIVAFNWYSVLIFDLSNQRSPESVQEDLVNKPWRPIPTGKVTPEQTRKALLVAIPAVIAANYALGVWKEGVFILVLTWFYNDLRGCDEVYRDVILAFAFGFYNSGSLQLAFGGYSGATMSMQAYIWTAIISGMILTTMQVSSRSET